MNNIKRIPKYYAAFMLLAVVGVYGCLPESKDTTLGPRPEATFVIEPVADKNNTYTLRNTTPGAFISLWDVGSGFEAGDAVITSFFPDQGVYDIRLATVTSGGADTSAVQTITIETSDPVAGNLVVGGKMGADAWDHWQKVIITEGVDWHLEDGKMTATGGNWGHAAIYQPIEVVAGRKYRFGMRVSGKGATDTWFEVYFGTQVPGSGDYNSGGIQLALNTWAGCGRNPFNGNLATLACDGALRNKNGEVTFDESGTIYLFIKTGGSYLGDGGISITNVEFRGTN